MSDSISRRHILTAGGGSETSVIHPPNGKASRFKSGNRKGALAHQS